MAGATHCVADGGDVVAVGEAIEQLAGDVTDAGALADQWHGVDRDAEVRPVASLARHVALSVRSGSPAAPPTPSRETEVVWYRQAPAAASASSRGGRARTMQPLSRR